jgi:hypothetical protein
MFLKADPREMDLPTQFFVLAKDPYPTGGGSGRVIPLFGEYDTWGGFGTITGPDHCLIEGKGPGGPGEQGHCAKTVNGHDDSMAGAPNIFSGDITSLIVNLSHIPLDLPGEWYVGVAVSVTHATYNGGKPEVISNPNNTFRYPGMGFKLADHSFLSYIWISTPCNGAEVGACDK